jgi:hypothetical protein
VWTRERLGFLPNIHNQVGEALRGAWIRQGFFID